MKYLLIIYALSGAGKTTIGQPILATPTLEKCEEQAALLIDKAYPAIKGGAWQFLCHKILAKDYTISI